MIVRVVLRVDVDVDAWRAEYGEPDATADDVRTAVRGSIVDATQTPGVLAPDGIIRSAEDGRHDRYTARSPPHVPIDAPLPRMDRPMSGPWPDPSARDDRLANLAGQEILGNAPPDPSERAECCGVLLAAPCAPWCVNASGSLAAEYRYSARMARIAAVIDGRATLKV